jgi:hypothetical protein
LRHRRYANSGRIAISNWVACAYAESLVRAIAAATSGRYAMASWTGLRLSQGHHTGCPAGPAVHLGKQRDQRVQPVVVRAGAC